MRNGLPHPKRGGPQRRGKEPQHEPQNQAQRHGSLRRSKAKLAGRDGKKRFVDEVNLDVRYLCVRGGEGRVKLRKFAKETD